MLLSIGWVQCSFNSDIHPHVSYSSFLIQIHIAFIPTLKHVTNKITNIDTKLTINIINILPKEIQIQKNAHELKVITLIFHTTKIV